MRLPDGSKVKKKCLTVLAGCALLAADFGFVPRASEAIFLQPTEFVAPPAGPQHFDIVSYNIQFLTPEWFPLARVDGEHFPNTVERARLIAQEVYDAYGCPDVMNLQETAGVERVEALVQKLRELCDEPDYWIYYGPQLDLSDTEHVLKGAAALIGNTPTMPTRPDPSLDDEIAIVTRLQPVSAHESQFSLAAGDDYLAAKGVLHLRVWKAGVGLVDVFNTHLNATSSPHESQFLEVGDMLESHTSAGVPWALTGDFNTDPGDDRWGQLIRAVNRGAGGGRVAATPALCDQAPNLCGATEAVPTGMYGERQPGDRRIDHVFVGNALLELTTRTDFFETDGIPAEVVSNDDGFGVRNYRIASDHAAIWTRFALLDKSASVAIPSIASPRQLEFDWSLLSAITRDGGALGDRMEWFNAYMTVRVGEEVTTYSMPPRSGTDTFDPQVLASVPIPAGPRNVTVQFHVEEDDDFSWFNDYVDINPVRPEKDPTFQIDTQTGSILLHDTPVGQIGHPVETKGSRDPDDESARSAWTATLHLDSTAPPPPLSFNAETIKGWCEDVALANGLTVFDGSQGVGELYLPPGHWIIVNPGGRAIHYNHDDGGTVVICAVGEPRSFLSYRGTGSYGVVSDRGRFHIVSYSAARTVIVNNDHSHIVLYDAGQVEIESEDPSSGLVDLRGATAAVSANWAAETLSTADGSIEGSMRGIRWLIGSEFDDDLVAYGYAAAVRISGEGGNDHIRGTVHNDELSGGAGEDTIVGHGGSDNIQP